MMKILFRLCLSLMFSVLVTILVRFNVYAESINPGQVVDSYKVWTIKFSNTVQFDKFTKNYISIVDSKGATKEITLELSSDKKSIKVSPGAGGYTPGEKYTLKITKGLKNEKSKDLKKEISMDFYIGQSEDNKNYSVNNARNRALVVQDENWIYYSNLDDNGYIYKMKKDGTSKQVLYKGKGGTANLNIVNDYIYFVEDDPLVEEDADRICRIKKDGTGRVETLYSGISIANYMQIEGENIYYSDLFGLYKGDIRGGEAKRLVDKIENDSDEVLFVVKDGAIYYWGSNYITGKRTGIYKINSDGTERTCMVKNTSTAKLTVDSVSIDDEYVYYLDTLGALYKANINGTSPVKLGSFSDVSNINVFDGYIYYSSQGSIYKLKTDGTGKSLATDDVSTDYQYINIVDGQLWYYNVYGELSKASLTSTGNPTVLEEGKTFYVKGLNDSSSKIIKYDSSDINNDGDKENIILAGDYENYSYINLKLFIQNPSSGEIISYISLIDATCEEKGNKISLGDYNEDEVNDIKIDLLTNMQRGVHSTYIYSLSNNKLNKIFDERMITGEGQDFTYELLDNANIKISDGINGYYLVDLSKDEADHYSSLKDIGVGPGLTVYYEGKDSDGDGALELHRTVYLVGISYSDFLCSVETIYKYNSSTGRWEYKDFAVESEFYPYESFKQSSSNGQDDSTQVIDKSAVQSLVEEGGYIYYVQDYTLYRVSKDLKVSKVMIQSPLPKIQISDGWIYYISRYGVNLHRAKLDGTSDEVLLNSVVNGFSISGDWIYFSEDISGIYKMKKDKSELTRLSFDKGADVTSAGDWVYYINSRDWKLYKVKTDGTENLGTGEIITHELNSNTDDVYYFVRFSAGSGLYKMNANGTGSKEIEDRIIGRYAVYNGFIYYINMDNNSIYRVKLDGTGYSKVSDVKAEDIIGVSGDFIYYAATDEVNTQHIYRVSIEGGEAQIVN